MLLSRIKLLVFLWLAAEILAFVFVAKWIGLPGALLLAILSSLLGWTLLKRAGTSAMLKMRAALDGRRIVEGSGRDVLDDTLATLGALALVMPGFLSDVVGLALAVPKARLILSRWIGRGRLAAFVQPDGRRQAAGPSTIDLAPDQWHQTDGSHDPLSKYRSPNSS